MDSTLAGKTGINERKMQIFDKIHDMQDVLHALEKKGKTIGFVPTMGALHAGHLSLVQKAADENDIVVVSIFVNPTQFNNPDDLKNYPHTPEADEIMLKNIHVDFLFKPNVNEIYHGNESINEIPNVGRLGELMEGVHRRGHFSGVVQIVKRLFEIVRPTRAYFGEKDFQQLAIIRNMVNKIAMPVNIVPCQTIREENGLAMSSRNMRLTDDEKKAASEIFRALIYVKENTGKTNPQILIQEAIQKINSNAGLKVEYIEIADEENLEPVSDWKNHKSVRVFAAVFCNSIRLIDNIKLY